MSDQIHVSTVPCALSTETRDYDARKLVEVIRTGGKDVRGRVEQLRETLQRELASHGDPKRAKQAVGELKKQLPAVLWSGTFTKRANDALVQYSGLLCADLDGLNGSLPDARQKLLTSPHAWAVFTSPSGDGLKAVFKVPADVTKHGGSFRAVEQHIRALTGVQIDEACKDVARLCFLSHDPELYHNANAIPIEPLPESQRPARVSNGVVDLNARQRIAVELLGSIDWRSETEGFCACPGKDRHTAGNGAKDCKVYLDGPPSLHCVHNSCRAIVDAVEHSLRSQVGKAEYVAPTNTAKVETPKQAVTPRALSALLEAVEAFLRRYVVFQYPEQAKVCALWAIHTWAFNAFDYTPYLSVFAAEKRSGKSRLLEVLSLLVCNARLTSGSSSAALIRSVGEDNPPTILLDEVDAVYSKKNDAEAENTRQFLNAGFRRGAKFLRCVGQGGAMEVKEFPAFCPKALSGIGRCLPDTVLDRSLAVELVRQSREDRAERFREREAEAKVATLRAELEAWVQLPGVIDVLRDARPALPEELTDRQQDYCEPLLAIADMAGGDWLGRSRVALIKLCSQEEDASLGVKLLTDIKGIFDSKGSDKLHTIDILNALVAIEDDRPWAAWWLDNLKHDKPEKPASRLSKLLKPYGTKQRPIKSRPIRLSDKVARGYEIDDFKHAFERYLPPPEKAVTSVTSVTYEGKSVTAPDNVTALGVTNGVSGRDGSGSDNLRNVTAASTNVTAPGAKGVTQIPLVERPFVTGVTAVTPFPGSGREAAEDPLIEETKRLFNAVPTGSIPDSQCPKSEHAS
jgi:hypothetical protein